MTKRITHRQRWRVALACTTALGSLSGKKAFAETVTLHVKADKSVLLPGEHLTLDVFARLDPGVGAPSFWYPPNGGSPIPGTVAALGGFGGHFLVSEREVSIWSDFKKNPQLAQSTPPSFASDGIFWINLFNEPSVFSTDTLLFSVSITLKDYSPGQVIFMEDPSAWGMAGPYLDVPGYGYQGNYWTLIHEPLIIPIVPSPGAACLGAVFAGVFAFTRHRSTLKSPTA